MQFLPTKTCAHFVATFGECGRFAASSSKKNCSNYVAHEEGRRQSTTFERRLEKGLSGDFPSRRKHFTQSTLMMCHPLLRVEVSPFQAHDSHGGSLTMWRSWNEYYRGDAGGGYELETGGISSCYFRELAVVRSYQHVSEIQP